MGPIVYSYKVNNQGKAININSMPEVISDQEYCWFHLSANHKKSMEWLMKHTTMSSVAMEMLLSKDSRPNVVQFPKGVLLTLRAVNIDNELSKEVFNAINIWISDSYVITSRHIKILAINDLADQFENDQVPPSKSSLILQLIHHLQKRVVAVVRELEDQIEHVEGRVINGEKDNIRSEIINLRKKTVEIRRYLVPQREALYNLSHEGLNIMDKEGAIGLRYYYDKSVRLVEELDIAREHILLVQEEVVNLQNDRMNRSMYKLSILSALFLPLGFITGLLGVNLGGIPGGSNKYAFRIVVIVSLVYLLVSSLYYILKGQKNS